MSAHFRVASMNATRIAHNPYRTRILREPLLVPKITFKTRIISKIVNIKNRIVNYFASVLKRTTSGRTVRRSVRTSNLGARNKDDPHLEKRV